METVNDKVFHTAFGWFVADSALPDRDGFCGADENAGHPPRQQQCQKRVALHVSEQGVVGIVNGVELVVDAVVYVLDVGEGNIVEKEEIRLMGNDDSSRNDVVPHIHQIQTSCAVKSSYKQDPQGSAEEIAEKDSQIEHHNDDYLGYQFDSFQSERQLYWYW